MEQMERLQFTDFMLSFTNLIMSVILFIYCTLTLSSVCSARVCLCVCVCACVCVCHGQTQAEAHYKGHKHARKLKALETQRNRQKNGHSPSTTGKDMRDRERGLMGRGTVPTDPHLKDITGIHLSFFKGTPLAILWRISGNWRDVSTKAWLLPLSWLITSYYLSC